jgi:CheY-like chemotaxis protein
MTRILVIDDDRTICDVIEHILSAAGYSVTLAHSGPAGLEAVQSEPFAVALVDLCMPGVNGLDIIRALQDSAPEMRLIMVSGLIADYGGTPDFLGMATNLQGVARLAKPIRRQALLDLVKESAAPQRGQEGDGRVSTAV